MLGSAALVAFASSTDLDRAEAFYATTLGLPLVTRDGFACQFDAHGTPLRVTLVDALTPAPGTVLGWLVPDIHGTVRALVDRGVTFARYDGMGQDHDGVWTAPSGDQVAWFPDPDGNTLSLTQAVRPA
ncbi:MAG TPA: VOC family protein [Acidimicrobiia bacterium]|nr:VOC family protein [Acidimicrobiia bacterium]